MGTTTTAAQRQMVALELLRFRSATRAYLNSIRELESWAIRAADINRLARPDYGDQLDYLLCDLRTAILPTEMGTPASIARILADVLGEVHEGANA